jgi:hypothetical protein
MAKTRLAGTLVAEIKNRKAEEIYREHNNQKKRGLDLRYPPLFFWVKKKTI